MNARAQALAALREVAEAATGIVVRDLDDVALAAEEKSREPQIWIDPGEATIEPMLSPLIYDVRRTAYLRVLTLGADTGERDAEADRVIGEIGAALLADVTLGGAVEYAAAQPPVFEVGEADGAAAGVLLPVEMTYLSPNAAEA